MDWPANRSCFLELAKAASDGTAEFTGKVGGDEDVIQKALGADGVTKTAAADDDFVNVDLPKGASISISPKRLRRSCARSSSSSSPRPPPRPPRGTATSQPIRWTPATARARGL